MAQSEHDSAQSDASMENIQPVHQPLLLGGKYSGVSLLA